MIADHLRIQPGQLIVSSLLLVKWQDGESIAEPITLLPTSSHLFRAAGARHTRYTREMCAATASTRRISCED